MLTDQPMLGRNTSPELSDIGSDIYGVNSSVDMRMEVPGKRVL